MTKVLQNIIGGFRVAGLLTLLFCSAGVKAQVANTQRYVTLMLLNLSNDGVAERRLIEMAHEYGMNSVYLTIPWDRVYYNSPSETPNWTRYDDQIRLATSLGMSVAIRVHVARNKSRLNGFWSWANDGMKDHLKISQMGAYQTTTFRYNHEGAVAKAAGFVNEVTKRYKWVHDQNKLIFISVSNTPEQEAGYPFDNFEPDTDTPKIYQAIYECSDQSMNEFRAWLKGHYKKIERLNFAWGTDMTSFDEAGPRLTPWEPRESFGFRYGKDWYLFRHEILKRYTESLINAVKQVDPRIRYVSDYGSVFDGLSGLRGTVAFGNLNEKADGVKINDAPEFDNRFSMDVIRGGMPKGAFLGNEVFVGSGVSLTEAEIQANENFAHGADMVTFVISTTAAMRNIQPVIMATVARWQSTPKAPFTEKTSVPYSTLMSIEKSIQNVVYSHWRTAYNQGNQQPVKLVPNDDLFSPAYWEVTKNQAPYLKVPLPMQIMAIGKAFSFPLPLESFDDVDGKVTKIELPDLPGWLKYDGKTISGKSDTFGDTRIAVRATDDEGATFTAYFTLRIDTRENANKPPVLAQNVGPLIVKVNEPFTYKLPEGLFRDDDGTITRIEALELPAWLTFRDGTFTGTSGITAEHRIVLKAYDDLNAFIEAYVTVKVVEPQDANNPPVLWKAIPVQYAPEKKLFSYELPKDIFADHDGYIASVTLQNHPTWLSINFNRIYGTPPAEGVYRFFVRAYDNYGAFVDAPFVLRIEKPYLTFTLQKAGNIVAPEIIREIVREDHFSLDSLPDLLNISATGNYSFDRLVLRLSGPYEYEARTRRLPFSLYPSNQGFAPFIGKYSITGEAYTWNDSLIFSYSNTFTIGKGDHRDDLTGDMAVWTAYPVPFREVINVKTDIPEEPGFYRFSVVTSAGHRVPVPEGFVIRTGNLCQLNVGKLGLRSGLYFIEAEQNGQIRKRLKVVKQ